MNATETLPGARGGRPTPVRVQVISGPDRGAHALLWDGTLVIGTRPDCGLVLTDSTVSRQHASVELAGAGLRVVDLGSKNGLRFQGSRFERAELPVGAGLQLGETHVALLPALVVPEPSAEVQTLHGLQTRAPAMKALFDELLRSAAANVPVLVSGETGSGKECVARALHAASPRAQAPFVVFHCGHTTQELASAQLFGHARGAFTGAVGEARGVFEAATGGTLFLDDVGELPLELQPLLLRVLSEGSYTRVGDSEVRRADFRLIAASQLPFEALVATGRLRADLFYRLDGVHLRVPPLRERREDIPLLAEGFTTELLGRPAALPPEVVSHLCVLQWPGNVRELKNVVQRLTVMGEGALSETGAALPVDFQSARAAAIAAFEKSYLEALLKRHHGSTPAAAKAAQLSKSYLYRMLEEHGIDSQRARRRRA